MDKDTLEMVQRQSAMIDTLLEKVSALEFCVFALSASHPDKNEYFKEVDQITKVLRDPPDKYWEDVASKVEALALFNTKDRKNDGD